MSDARPQHDDRPERVPDLDEHEEQKATEEQSLDAKTTLEVIRRQGEKELERATAGLAWSGLAAGLAMGFSLVAQGVLRHGLPDAEWRPLVVSLGYAAGFLIVILGSQQLFTENTLTAVVPLLARRDGRTLANVARLWAVVLVANLAGALLFALVAARTEAFSPEMRHAFAELSREATEPSFGLTVLRGIFAGWLIALMVWMLPAAQAAHLWVIVIITWLVGAAHLSHVVAGAVEAFYLVWAGEKGFGDALGGFVLPALIGNVLGGTALVAALNHGQVTAGEG
ncbi:formate/nitrite transporter family protein [Longimicrobium sp.]|uniref:formate/nitrite transporter family protein n=1 Tax=Longimicrobium sp. TaxID=2029185 RepID=UPI002E2FB8B5|nr:formate/nitrite transporter family protein [Longimicrobium sp.]HEX6039900.1 formate/nitrite transporter family protein [Longimicrobium sp.]